MRARVLMHLPPELWRVVCGHLTRDDVASVARVEPAAAAAHGDTLLSRFEPGGMPVCRACCRRRLREMGQTVAARRRSWATGEGTIDDEIWEQLLERGAAMPSSYHVDMLTLLVRRVLERAAGTGAAPAGSSSGCFLCAHAGLVDAEVRRACWRRQLRRYLRHAASEVRALCRESDDADRRSGYNNAGWISERWQMPLLICSRCGTWACKTGATCSWYFGEARVNERLEREAREEYAACLARSLCSCSSCERAIARKDKRLAAASPAPAMCACRGCINTPSSCGRCSACCRDAGCYAHHGPRHVRTVHNAFVRVIRNGGSDDDDDDDDGEA